MIRSGTLCGNFMLIFYQTKICFAESSWFVYVAIITKGPWKCQSTIAHFEQVFNGRPRSPPYRNEQESDYSWAPFHWRFLHRNSNSMEISFRSHLDSNTVVATNFGHGTTAVLSVVACFKKCVAIWWPATELQQGEVSIEFELRAKNRQWNEPRDNVVVKANKLVRPKIIYVHEYERVCVCVCCVLCCVWGSAPDLHLRKYRISFVSAQWRIVTHSYICTLVFEINERHFIVGRL